MLAFMEALADWHEPFLESIGVTVFITVTSCALGLLLGIACAWSRVYGGRLLRMVVACYVEFFRNTPVIIQVFFIYFSLPAVGLRLMPVSAAVAALTINLGAYACEIVRAGIAATPCGQIEAAQSLSLSRWHIFTRVILPMALSRVWPAIVSQLVIIMLISPVCSLISTEELSHVTNRIASATFLQFEAYIAVTALYLLLSVLLRRCLVWLGPRLLFGCAPAGGAR